MAKLVRNFSLVRTANQNELRSGMPRPNSTAAASQPDLQTRCLQTNNQFQCRLQFAVEQIVEQNSVVVQISLVIDCRII